MPISLRGYKDLSLKFIQLTDVLTYGLSFLTAYLLALIFPNFFEPSILKNTRPEFFLALMVVMYPILRAEFQLFHLYRFKLNHSTLVEWPRIFNATAIASILTILFFQFFLGIAPLKAFLASWLLMLVFIPLGRFIVRSFMRVEYRKGRRMRRTLIVGGGRIGQKMAEKLLNRPVYGLKPIGFVDEIPPHNSTVNIPYLGSKKHLAQIIHDQQVDHVIMAFPSHPDREIMDIIKQVDSESVFFTVVPRFFELTIADYDSDDIDGIPLSHLGISRIGQRSPRLKRALDVTLSLLLLALFSPLLVIMALSIKIEGGKTVFFRQARAGRDGTQFKMIKFRTMVENAEDIKSEILDQSDHGGPIFKMKHDPRITKVGKWLRKFSIDETPQLLNVLKGEMSIVGPRPLPLTEARALSELEAIRQKAVPGITGLWQVSGRSDLPYDEMMRLDYLYLRNYSFWLDIKILVLTLPAILSRRGAY